MRKVDEEGMEYPHMVTIKRNQDPMRKRFPAGPLLLFSPPPPNPPPPQVVEKPRVLEEQER